jgi:hypothetical protein
VGGRYVLREKGLDAYNHRDDLKQEKTAIATGLRTNLRDYRQT